MRKILPWSLVGLLIVVSVAGCSREKAERRREAAIERPAASAPSKTPAADSGKASSPAGAVTTPPTTLAPPDSGRSSESLDDLSNALVRWGVKATVNGETPHIPSVWVMMLRPYHDIWLGDPAKPEVFLTFDAGYEGGYTPHLLDVLKAEGVKAAFFLSGHYVTGQPVLVKRMVAEGHIVGSHGYSHRSMPTLEVPVMRTEIVSVADKFKALTGKDMHYFRPPSGEVSERTLAVAHDLGYTTVMWSLAYEDWEPLPGGPEESYQTLITRLHNGAVILLHVTSKDNAEAFERMIAGIKAAGYRFGTLDELTVGRADTTNG
jgi:peptidoglycan-N-acetylmuramic acid deacetylase